jgi:hypothetical protein
LNFKKSKSLDNDSLQNKCLNVEGFLKHDINYDLNGFNLFSKLKVLKEILQIEVLQLTIKLYKKT